MSLESESELTPAQKEFVKDFVCKHRGGTATCPPGCDRTYVLVGETGVINGEGTSAEPNIESFLCPECRKHIPALIEHVTEQALGMMEELAQIAKLAT